MLRPNIGTEKKSLEDLEHLSKLEEAAVKAAAEAAEAAAAVEEAEVPQHIKEMFDQEVTAEKNAEANKNKK